MTFFLEEYGFEAYGRYWKLIEFLSERYDGESHKFTIHNKVLRDLLKFRTHLKLSNYLVTINLLPSIKVVVNDNQIEINAPILLELQQKDFKRARPKSATVAPKNKNKNKNKIHTKSAPENVPILKSKIIEIINYFNLVTGKSYKTDDDSAVRVIMPLLNQEYTIDDFKHVVDVKHTDWKDRPEMDSSIRPITFFAEDKFSSYLNQKKNTQEEYDFSIFK